MGYQQTYAKVRDGRLGDLMRERYISPVTVVKVKKEVKSDFFEFKKGELFFVFHGERYYQQMTSDEGLSELDEVLCTFSIDLIAEDIDPNRNIHHVLDEYFVSIPNKEFDRLHNGRTLPGKGLHVLSITQEGR